MIAKDQTDKEKKRRQVALQKKYSQRITIARQGRDAFGAKDFLTASKKYNEYLSILANFYDLEDPFALSPTLFDSKKDVTEMLLISHVYWDIARINEMTPKLQKNFTKAVTLFVKFTVNQPFQVLNAEMLRKYNKKNKNSPCIVQLNQAYQQIFVQSKKCFIATLCYGEGHPTTLTLRSFKQDLLSTKSGFLFVEVYYRISSPLTLYCEEHKLLRVLLVSIAKPFLSLLAKTSSLSIFR